MKTSSIIGIVRSCAVIPRSKTVTLPDGKKEVRRNDYVLLKIRSGSEKHRFVAGAKFLVPILEQSGFTVPEYDTKSVLVKGIQGKVVDIDYETTIEGRTQYIDKHTGETLYHQNSGMQIREIDILNGVEESAHRLAGLESQGVSEFSLKTAIDQRVKEIVDNASIIRDTLRAKSAEVAQHKLQAKSEPEPEPEPELEPEPEPVPQDVEDDE